MSLTYKDCTLEYICEIIVYFYRDTGNNFRVPIYRGKHNPCSSNFRLVGRLLEKGTRLMSITVGFRKQTKKKKTS